LAELARHVGFLSAAVDFEAAMEKDEGLHGRQRAGAARQLLDRRRSTPTIVPLERAELAPSGDLYVRLAQVEVSARTGGARHRAERAIERAAVEPANASFCRHRVRSSAKLDEAKAWFERAASDEGYRAQAEGLLKQIEMELATKS
jgi:hypothetical protein